SRLNCFLRTSADCAGAVATKAEHRRTILIICFIKSIECLYSSAKLTAMPDEGNADCSLKVAWISRHMGCRGKQVKAEREKQITAREFQVFFGPGHYMIFAGISNSNFKNE